LLEDSAIRTVSSAYKMINNFIKISNLLSSSSEIEFNPGTFSCMKKSSKLFKNNENRKGIHFPLVGPYFTWKIFRFLSVKK
jgi:hypothetical protein